MATNLANTLIVTNYRHQDPKKLHYPILYSIPSPKSLSLYILFEPEKLLIVRVLWVDEEDNIYIYDTTIVCVEVSDNLIKSESELSLSAHILGRPLNHNNVIHRKCVIYFTKLFEESGLGLLKKFLGLIFNTMRLLIYLPEEIFVAYLTIIIKCCNKGTNTSKEWINWSVS